MKRQHFERISVKKQEIEWIYVPDVVYSERDGIKRCLQMIVPYKREWHNDKKVPVVLFIPGSAWHRQEMYNGIPKHYELAKRGFAVIDMQYRESELALFPAQVTDAKTAIRFIHTIAGQFHLDMDNLFIAGDSSGAHIALITALTAGYGEFDPDFDSGKPCQINGVISWFAPTDIFLSEGSGPMEDMLGVDNIHTSPEITAAACCQTYITAERHIPPVLMFHGTDDELVSVKHGRALFERLKQFDKEVEYYEVEHENHGGMSWWGEEILDIVERFIDKKCVQQTN